MHRPAATIWDTKIQCVCSIVSAREGDDIELWLCGNFGQVSLDDSRIAVNPNRLYPIEPAIRRERRFAIGVLSEKQRDIAIRLSRIGRRAIHKPQLLELEMAEDQQYAIPYAPSCPRTLFCEAEDILDTGDHTLIVARVLESRIQPQADGERPLLYRSVAANSSPYPRLSQALDWAIANSGAKELLQKYLQKRRGTVPVNLPANTYEIGGQTAEEIAIIDSYGLRNYSRRIAPPAAPAVLRRRIPVCVAGVGMWGSFHCQLFASADPHVDLYVCGRNRDRAERLGRAVGAKDVITGLERAVEDKRIEAISLALPHHTHARAAELCAQHGKHTLVEKPIALNLADADAMIDAAQRAGIILMVAEDMHYRPAVRAAVEMIDAGDVGEPLHFMAHGGGVMRPRGWKADPATMGGGILMDMGVHYVRAMRLLMGEPDEAIAFRGMQIDTKNGGEDSAQISFRSRFGWQAHILLSWAGPRGHSPDLIVCGDRGVLHLWPARNHIDLYPAEQRPIPQLLSYVRPQWLAEKLIRPEMQRVRRKVVNKDCQGYLTEVREFLAAVTEGRPPASPPADARRDVEIVLSSYESMRADRWMAVPPYSPGHGCHPR